MLYELNPEDRYEYWDGIQIVREPTSADHAYIVANLTILIGSHAKKYHPGKVFDSNVPLYLHGQLTRKEFRLADLSFVARDRLDIVQYKGIFGPPDLVIEVLSEGKRNIEQDRIEKYRLYEQFGVSEYWIVHPYHEEIDMFVLQDKQYQQVEQSAIFPELKLKKVDVFD